MPKVFRLGYVTLNTTTLDATRQYYTEVLGTTEVATDGDGTSYLSFGLDHHNVALKPAQGASLANLGFQIDPAIDLADLAKQIRGHGLAVEIKSDSQPGVRRAIEVEVVKDNVVQIYDAIEMPAPGFATGSVGALKLGHIAIISPEAEKLIKFYGDILGFWTTDWIANLATFMTCNKDHHVLNFVSAPISKIHHIAYELEDAARHTPASDLLRRLQRPVLWGPSRHTAGHNIASYHYAPDRVLTELYAELDVFVPELGFFEPRPWHEDLPMKPKRWEAVNAWGTEFAFDFTTA